MRTIITALALSVSALAYAQLYKDASAAASDRVEDLLGRMTLEETIDYIGGYKDF